MEIGHIMPKGFPGLGLAPERFAEKVNELSHGRLVIRVYGAGELVPSFEVFNAVSKGTAQMGALGSILLAGEDSGSIAFFCYSLWYDGPGNECLAALWWRP